MKKSMESVDVCIIGSGAGGGVVAKELSEKGMSVVVLEAGRRFDPLRDYTATTKPDLEVSSWHAYQQFSVPSLAKVTLDDPYMNRPVEVHGVGGGTIRYLAYALRMPPDDFRIYSVDGIGDDWPFSYEDLVPNYRKVELELGVSGLANDPWTPLVEPYPNPPFEYSYANKILKRGFDKLGLNLWPTAMARLSRPFDGRPACVQCGRCDDGCMTKAKSSMDVTYIAKAEQTGRVKVLPESTVTHIRVNKEGKPTGVVYVDNKRLEHEQQAKIIIVSAGAIQSPRILLNSVSNAYPQGLGNHSGLVGKYFHQHLGVTGKAVFPDRIDSYRGFFGGATCQDFGKTMPNHSFARGFIHELHSGISGPVWFALDSKKWGAGLKNYMADTFGHIAAINGVGEQIPVKNNSIELDSEVKDEYGLPVPRIKLKYIKNDLLMLEAMKKNIYEILSASGAKEISFPKAKIGASPHNMGTCRMGNDPKSSVLNSFCQSHDAPNLFVIDSSCFVSGGTANPSLTIHAIADRASNYIIDQAKKMNI